MPAKGLSVSPKSAIRSPPFKLSQGDCRPPCRRYPNTANDLAFLQGAANVVGMAIERERQDRSLKAALAHQEVLFKEITHRVKNSLAIVEGPF
jgi:hypothetical protein